MQQVSPQSAETPHSTRTTDVLIKGHRGLSQHVMLSIGCTLQLQSCINMQESTGTHTGEAIPLHLELLWITSLGEEINLHISQHENNIQFLH